jgi:hypothetical protein
MIASSTSAAGNGRRSGGRRSPIALGGYRALERPSPTAPEHGFGIEHPAWHLQQDAPVVGIPGS